MTWTSGSIFSKTETTPPPNRGLPDPFLTKKIKAMTSCCRLTNSNCLLVRSQANTASPLVAPAGEPLTSNNRWPKSSQTTNAHSIAKGSSKKIGLAFSPTSSSMTTTKLRNSAQAYDATVGQESRAYKDPRDTLKITISHTQNEATSTNYEF